MNHHTRSYSEQPQVPVLMPAVNVPNNQPESIIRIHSDSQQSLDRLFNPQSQNTVPLRNRNLPLSFFNLGLKADNGTNGTPNGTQLHAGLNTNGGLHNRSVSFDQHQHQQHQQASRLINQRSNLHTRTHSSLAPMPRLDSNQASNQSSREVLYANSMDHQDSDDVVSSTYNVSSLNTDCNNHHIHNHDLHHNHHDHATSNQIQHHPINDNYHHHHSNSNGWSSAANSMDDLTPSPTWTTSGGQQPSNGLGLVQQAATPVQAMRVAQQHQQALIGAPDQVLTQHQQSLNNVNTMREAQPPINHACPNHLAHRRSMSYHNQQQETHANHSFHARTHSTVVPVSGGPACTHHNPGGHLASSHEALNRSNVSGSAGWSSSGYSTDDMTTTGHCWTQGQAQVLTSQPQIQVAPVVPQRHTTLVSHNHNHNHNQNHNHNHNHNHSHTHHQHHHHQHQQVMIQHQHMTNYLAPQHSFYQV